jgi:hypothetical protein
MIKPHLLAPKERKVIAWDLEWIPHTEGAKARERGFEPGELRLAGVYEPQGGYRWYTTIEAFLDGELTKENNGAWMYAHAGGSFDMTYVFEYLNKVRNPDITVEACMLGSSAAIVTIKKGRNRWHFLDSFRLIPTSLAKIATWFGTSKLKDETTNVFYAPLGELATYNEQDCRILHRAIMFFQEVLMDLGGQMQKTVASSALMLFRMAHLDREIQTSAAVNEIAQKAYIASRVEAFSMHAENGEYYDINSCFPYAMTFPQPGNYLCTVYGIPDDDSLYLANVRVKVPEMDIPPLPYVRANRKERRIFHPVGEWDAWLTQADVKLALEAGAQILKVREVMLFEPFNGLSEYANSIYALRKAAEDEGYKQVLKILLNSLYGKFAEQSLKRKLILNPPAEFFDIPEYETSGNGTGRRMISPGIWELIERREVSHAHVPISANITAISRGLLTRYLWEAPKVYYCDTDGFIVPGGVQYPTSNELGALKHEKSIRNALFVQPKLYAYQYAASGEYTVKAKGFSKVRGHWEAGNPAMQTDENDPSRSMTFDDFAKIANGQDVAVNQFVRVKTLIRSGDFKPREVTQRKGLRNKALPKRVFSEDGASSRPWTIAELDKAR